MLDFLDFLANQTRLAIEAFFADLTAGCRVILFTILYFGKRVRKTVIIFGQIINLLALLAFIDLIENRTVDDLDDLTDLLNNLCLFRLLDNGH